MRHKTVPALRFLIERGRYWPNCVTVFPTMTASVDSSLVTGVYPDRHRIPGLIWYHPEEQSIVNYINGWKCILKLGLSDCVKHVLYNLNEKHLSKQVTTVFEDLAAKGKTSASINAIVHRGTKKHRVKPPFLVELATKFQSYPDVSGPDVLTLGSMVESEVTDRIPARLSGAHRMYGINDRFAVMAAKTLIQEERTPDFMLVYFPDNDHEVHRKNPAHAEEALIKVDGQIQEILDTFESWDEALNQFVFIVISDHGQTRIGGKPRYNIDLDRLLQPFRVLQLGETVNGHDLAVANNERMAYIYPLKPGLEQRLIPLLVRESRLDLIAWKEGKGVRVAAGGSGRQLYFEREGPIQDIYGSFWTVEGEWGTLDLRPGEGMLDYGDYPDALSRLYGALYSQDIPSIAVTARPRYELMSRFFPSHLNGGSHGSLHKYDSLIPLIVAGTERRIQEPPRLVDIKSFIMGLFGG